MSQTSTGSNSGPIAAASGGGPDQPQAKLPGLGEQGRRRRLSQPDGVEAQLLEEGQSLAAIFDTAGENRILVDFQNRARQFDLRGGGMAGTMYPWSWSAALLPDRPAAAGTMYPWSAAIAKPAPGTVSGTMYRRPDGQIPKLMPGRTGRGRQGPRQRTARDRRPPNRRSRRLSRPDHHRRSAARG